MWAASVWGTEEGLEARVHPTMYFLRLCPVVALGSPFLLLLSPHPSANKDQMELTAGYTSDSSFKVVQNLHSPKLFQAL